MIIGFDAKGAALSSCEVGDYGRQTIDIVSRENTLNKLVLFTPLIQNNAYFNDLLRRKNISAITPTTEFSKRFKSMWHTHLMSHDIADNKIALYHGLCNELPFGIKDSGIKTIVTIHDTEFLSQHSDKPYILNCYRNIKTKYSCTNADKIIAISNSVKNDIISNYNIKADKIDVIYQDCNPIYKQYVSEFEIDEFVRRQNLPKRYILATCDGSKKSNTETLIEAMNIVRSNIGLVIRAEESSYLMYIRKLIDKKRLRGKVFIMTTVPPISVPVLYQGATLFIHPALHDNFGFRTLEAINCGLPVICGTCDGIREAAGPQSVYYDPKDYFKLAKAIDLLCDDFEMRDDIIKQGDQWLKRFSVRNQSRAIMRCYSGVLQE